MYLMSTASGRPVGSLFASGLQRLSGALLLRLVDWRRRMVLSVFGYVEGSLIFASRIIRLRYTSQNSLLFVLRSVSPTSASFHPAPLSLLLASGGSGPA